MKTHMNELLLKLGILTLTAITTFNTLSLF